MTANADPAPPSPVSMRVWPAPGVAVASRSRQPMALRSRSVVASLLVVWRPWAPAVPPVAVWMRPVGAVWLTSVRLTETPLTAE